MDNIEATVETTDVEETWEVVDLEERESPLVLKAIIEFLLS